LRFNNARLRLDFPLLLHIVLLGLHRRAEERWLTSTHGVSHLSLLLTNSFLLLHFLSKFRELLFDELGDLLFVFKVKFVGVEL
jgi:hypothetical protein